MSEKHACTNCGRTDPAQCHAGEFCAWDGAKSDQPADKAGPSLADAPNPATSETTGPSLSAEPPKRSKKKGLFLLAAAGLATLVGLKSCQDEPGVAPSPQPSTTPQPTPVPVDPTPQAFQLWILNDSQPLCREGTITDLSCRARFQLEAGSCVQPFTDYNGGNQGQWVRVTATFFKNGPVYEGLIDRSRTTLAPAGMTESACFAKLPPPPPAP